MPNNKPKTSQKQLEALFQLSVISYQLSVISFPFSVISYQFSVFSDTVFVAFPTLLLTVVAFWGWQEKHL
jgi:hypothetical protein